MAGLRDDVVPAVERSELFSGHSRADVEKAVAEFDEHTFLAGNRIVTEGREGVDFFIILAGEAEVVSESGRVALLRAGDFFGEVAALDGGPRTASVRTLSQVRCLCLPNGGFRPFLLAHPAFCVNVMCVMARRFRSVVTSARQDTA